MPPDVPFSLLPLLSPHCPPFPPSLKEISFVNACYKLKMKFSENLNVTRHGTISSLSRYSEKVKAYKDTFVVTEQRLLRENAQSPMLPRQCRSHYLVKGQIQHLRSQLLCFLLPRLPAPLLWLDYRMCKTGRHFPGCLPCPASVCMGPQLSDQPLLPLSSCGSEFSGLLCQ